LLAKRLLALLAYFKASTMPARISAFFWVKSPEYCNSRLQRLRFCDRRSFALIPLK